MKRFYDDVTIEQAPEGYGVMLDGKHIYTPSKKPLTVPAQALAEAIAQEWRDQGEQVNLSGMNLTRMAYGVLELEESDRAMLREETTAYITTELLCYRDGKQPDLLALQHATWQPELEWMREVMGIELLVTHDIMPLVQPQRSIETAERWVAAREDWQLVPVAVLVRMLGSLALVMGVAQRRLGIETALEFARLEASFQAAKWGDAEAIARNHHSADEEAKRISFFLLANDAGAAS